MGQAYAEVEYELKGRRYRTVHGFSCDAFLSQTTFAYIDYVNWGGLLINDPLFDAATDPLATEDEPRTLIEAVIYFHRYMQTPDVILRNLSINDGPTPGSGTGNFVSVGLDLQCRGNLLSNGSAIAGANTTMLITKQPSGFSNRKGRIFLRGAMTSSQVTAGDADGVTFLPGFRSAYELQLYEAIVGTGLGSSTRLRSYFGGAIGADGEQVSYCIPNTIKVTGVDPDTGLPTVKRIMSGFNDVFGMTVTDAQSRDTRRKKKSK